MKNIGSLTLNKGKLGDITARIWDAVPPCNQSCELYESSCPYDKKTPRCTLRIVYIESVIDSLNAAVKVKDELAIHRIGLLLVPLYSMLINIKLDMYMRGGSMRGSKGGIDGIYRECRDTIKMIDGMLASFCVETKGKFGEPKPDKGLLNGDSDYYDSLIEDGHIPA